MKQILAFLGFGSVIVIASAAGRNTVRDPAYCLERLRSDVQTDVTQIVAVFLSNNMDTFSEHAQAAAQRVVERDRLSQGERIVDPAAVAVENSVAETFENLSWEIRSSIKVFVATALKRLCTLENCCFT